MKILVLCNIYPPDVMGGYELGCKQAVDGLRNRGHEVRVLTSTPRTAVAVPFESHVSRRLQLSDLWYNATRPQSNPAVNRVWEADSNLFSAHNVHTLIQEIDSFQPDVVYVWMILGIGGLGLMGCLQYLKVPWVWHLMDEVPVYLCGNNWNVSPPLAEAFDRFISGHYISCSQAMVERIEAKGVHLEGEVEILPNWIVGPRPAPRESFYRQGTLRLISAGRVAKQKGVDLVIEAMRLLQDEGIDNFSLDVYGPIVDRSIPELARALDLDGHVRFRGTVSQAELATRFAEADVLAFPTHDREPFAFTPLEAAAQGCVPLVPRVCGNSEWLVHGVHCIKAHRSARAFADALAAILRGEIDVAAIGRRAQSVTWRDFHLDGVLPRIELTLAQAARSDRDGAGATEDAYRMALIAEKLSHTLVQEPFFA